MKKTLMAESDEVKVYALSDFVHKTAHGVACELRSSHLSSLRRGRVFLLDTNKSGFVAEFLWRKGDGLNYQPVNEQSSKLSAFSYMLGDVMNVQADVYGGYVEYYIEVKPIY